MIITDYGVPLMVGGKFKTISVVMYQEVIGQLNFGNGCVYGALLLIPAVIARRFLPPHTGPLFCRGGYRYGRCILHNQLSQGFLHILARSKLEAVVVPVVPVALLACN
jgi:hypothetical protein